MKTTRCTTCAAEFTDDELDGVACCPSCKTTGLPMSISQDTTIKINWHELRILTIWATNWAMAKCDESCQKSLAGVIRRLECQRKEDWPALTLIGEIKELPEALRKQGIECGGVELYQGKERIYPPKPRVVPEDES